MIESVHEPWPKINTIEQNSIYTYFMCGCFDPIVFPSAIFFLSAAQLGEPKVSPVMLVLRFFVNSVAR